HLENGNIYANAKDGLKGTSIHLDFPSVGATQNIIMAASLAKAETVFENRFMHVAEFKRMNANINVEGRSAKLEGKSQLQGAQVKATDLRAAAALILAGLVADGKTSVTELNHLDRGYVDLHGKLKQLGADIERIND
ncbi:UDP-N-acetylglucosamine 1-carboxyvinyltransferase, partial [Staphylococcus aureus]|nr:UDP-N-acetylglucosamine 1-carboxyvinyltransferase [Staphylococcus aureus]